MTALYDMPAEGIRGFPQSTKFSWPLARMSSVVTLNYGKALVEGSRHPGNIPVYGTNGRTGFHSNSLHSGPSVILGRKGMGNLGVEWCEGAFWVIDTAYFTTFDARLTCPKFFYYFAKFVGLNHLKDGTSNPSLSRDTFARQWFPSPPKRVQEEIASILSALDDKIDLIHCINETLQATARAIFKDWFIDFAPTRAKIEGRAAYLATDIWALFPDRLDSELKPASWNYMPLSVAATELRRGISPSYIADGGICVLNQKCIRNRQVNFGPSRRHDVSKRAVDGRQLMAGDILVNSTGVGTLGRVAQLWETDQAMVADSHVTVVRPNAEYVSAYYLGLDLTSREAEIEAMGEGTTGQTELSRLRLGSLLLVQPTKEVRVAFDNAVAPLIKRMSVNRREQQVLAETRDFLIPKLMSGEIQPKNAEAIADIAA